MKRMFGAVVVLVVVMLLAFSSVSFALLNGGDNTEANATALAGAAQQQGQIGINKNTNANKNLNANVSSNKNENINVSKNQNSNKQTQDQDQGQAQGQLQGQVANGTVKTKVEGDISTSEDNSKEIYYGNSWPSLSGNVGVSEANAYSVFGGIGVSSTEEYKICNDKLAIIDTLVQKGYMTKEAAQIKVNQIIAELEYTTTTKRFLGVLWKTSGRNLLNLMGLLSWNSFWKEGATPMDKVFEPRENTVDEEITGNQGYLN